MQRDKEIKDYKGSFYQNYSQGCQILLQQVYESKDKIYKTITGPQLNEVCPIINDFISYLERQVSKVQERKDMLNESIDQSQLTKKQIEDADKRFYFRYLKKTEETNHLPENDHRPANYKVKYKNLAKIEIYDRLLGAYRICYTYQKWLEKSQNGYISHLDKFTKSFEQIDKDFWNLEAELQEYQTKSQTQSEQKKIFKIAYKSYKNQTHQANKNLNAASVNAQMIKPILKNIQKAIIQHLFRKDGEKDKGLGLYFKQVMSSQNPELDIHGSFKLMRKIVQRINDQFGQNDKQLILITGTGNVKNPKNLISGLREYVKHQDKIQEKQLLQKEKNGQKVYDKQTKEPQYDRLVVVRKEKKLEPQL